MPEKLYKPNVAKSKIINNRKRATFSNGGMERIKDLTITRIPFTLLILLKGLSNLIVLTDDALLNVALSGSHLPRILKI